MTLIKIDEHVINLDNITHITNMDDGQAKIYFNSNYVITIIGKDLCDHLQSCIKKYLRDYIFKEP